VDSPRRKNSDANNVRINDRDVDNIRNADSTIRTDISSRLTVEIQTMHDFVGYSKRGAGYGSSKSFDRRYCRIDAALRFARSSIDPFSV
jgi:hypothetical protein